MRLVRGVSLSDILNFLGLQAKEPLRCIDSKMADVYVSQKSSNTGQYLGNIRKASYNAWKLNVFLCLIVDLAPD